MINVFVLNFISQELYCKNYNQLSNLDKATAQLEIKARKCNYTGCDNFTGKGENLCQSCNNRIKIENLEHLKRQK